MNVDFAAECPRRSVGVLMAYEDLNGLATVFRGGFEHLQMQKGGRGRTHRQELLREGDARCGKVSKHLVMVFIGHEKAESSLQSTFDDVAHQGLQRNLQGHVKAHGPRGVEVFINPAVQARGEALTAFSAEFSNFSIENFLKINNRGHG